MGKLVRLIGILLVFLITGSGLISAIEKGEPCPRFSLSKLKGGNFSSSDILGKKNLLIWLSNFDTNAIENIPDLINFYGQFNRNEVEFLIISVNGEDKKAALKASKEHFIPFPVLIDSAGTTINKLSGFYINGVVPIKNLFLVGKDKTIKLVDNYPGIPLRALETRLKEMK